MFTVRIKEVVSDFKLDHEAKIIKIQTIGRR